MSDFPLLSERAKMLREADVGGANLAPIDFETIAVVERLETLERNRDELWCRALSAEDTQVIQRVTHRFNELREDQPR